MSRLSWVRGNSVLMAVTLTQKKTDGTTEPIDLSVYDEWEAKVWRLSAYKKQDENVDAALDQEGHVVLSIPSSLSCGSYSIEITMEKDGYDRRSYETPVFRVVESNGEADVTYDVVQCQLSADIEMTFQLVPVAEVIGKNAYELWKELPGNDDKTLQDYIDEVLDLNALTAECEAAIVIATHPDYIGEDNYVYHWTNGAYVKTDIYCKGDPGTGGEVDWDDITDKPTFATVATSGSYNDLSNKPTIPAEVTESTVAGWGFTKNTGTYSKPSGGIPKTDLASGVQTSLGKADTALQSFTETDPTVPSWAKQQSKPTYTAQEVGALPSSTVIPAAPGTLNTDNSTAQSVSSSEALSGAIKLHKVSKTGSYDDLLNKPTIPAAQVQSDWNATTGMGVILNKPTIPTVPTNVSAFTNDAGYTTNVGTITGITMNGSSKGTSGVVNLGTVITSHQDISGKVDKTTTINGKALSSNIMLSASDVGAQATLTTQTAYTSKGTATKVPQITTNTLGQVTSITEVTITQPDISGKEDKMGIITVSATSLAPSVNKYYRFTSDVGTLAVTLPTVTDTTKVASIVFYLTTGASPNVTFTSSHSVVYQDGFQLDASKTYEVNALFNGAAWVLMAAEINTGS